MVYFNTNAGTLFDYSGHVVKAFKFVANCSVVVYGKSPRQVINVEQRALIITVFFLSKSVFRPENVSEPYTISILATNVPPAGSTIIRSVSENSSIPVRQIISQQPYVYCEKPSRENVRTNSRQSRNSRELGLSATST